MSYINVYLGAVAVYVFFLFPGLLAFLLADLLLLLALFLLVLPFFH